MHNLESVLWRGFDMCRLSRIVKLEQAKISFSDKLALRCYIVWYSDQKGNQHILQKKILWWSASLWVITKIIFHMKQLKLQLKKQLIIVKIVLRLSFDIVRLSWSAKMEQDKILILSYTSIEGVVTKKKILFKLSSAFKEILKSFLRG